MTQFLASVATIEEAQIAVSAGADIIDLKDPNEGALGAVSEDVFRAVTSQLARNIPLSSTIGDQPMDPETVLNAVNAKVDQTVDYIKIGFPNEPGRQDCMEALAPIAKNGTKLIALFFADEPFDPSVLEWAAENYFTGVMFDTKNKSKGSLTNQRSHIELKAFLSEARHVGLTVGLAGSLTTTDIPNLLPLNPDILGFRGALCANNDRTNTISLSSCRVVRDLIPKHEFSFKPETTPLQRIAEG